MAIVLRWAPFPGADVVSYNVYRSIIGFHPPLVALGTLDTKTLELKIEGGATQIITFDAVTAIVDKINATLTGAQAFLDDAGTGFLVRSDIREAPGSVEILASSTSLGDFGETARVITEKSEEELITNILALVDPEAIVSYNDPDGVAQDFYRLTTIDSSATESLPTPYKQATLITGPICVIEGIVTDLQGVRIPDVEVIAKLIELPQTQTAASHITKEKITTLTGSDGRFSLALLQGASVEICIPLIGLERTILVPVKAFEFLTEIKQDTGYQYNLGVQ